MEEEKGKNWLDKTWKKTVFPEMIKDKKEESEFKRKLKKEAKKEALLELKEELKAKYKKDELDKMTGNKSKDFLKKLANGFSNGSESEGSSNWDEKMNRMLGTKSEKKEDSKNDFEEKVRRMLK
jgi:hypothetical protein